MENLKLEADKLTRATVGEEMEPPRKTVKVNMDGKSGDRKVEELMTRIAELEEKVKELRADKAELREDNGVLRGENRELRGMVMEMVKERK